MKHLFSVCFLSLMALFMGNTNCTKQQSLAYTLQGFSIACDVAAPYAGAYSGYVLLAADASQKASLELQSTDPAAGQLTKILAILKDDALKTPDLTGANQQTLTKINAIAGALQAVISLVYQMQSQPGISANVVGTKSLALSSADKVYLENIGLQVAHVHAILKK
jgi:hypothetical protein